MGKVLSSPINKKGRRRRDKNKKGAIRNPMTLVGWIHGIQKGVLCQP
jgi:hypothetical protein